jgi:hypothetical protein
LWSSRWCSIGSSWFSINRPMALSYCRNCTPHNVARRRKVWLQPQPRSHPKIATVEDGQSGFRRHPSISVPPSSVAADLLHLHPIPALFYNKSSSLWLPFWQNGRGCVPELRIDFGDGEKIWVGKEESRFPWRCGAGRGKALACVGDPTFSMKGPNASIFNSRVGWVVEALLL